MQNLSVLASNTTINKFYEVRKTVEHGPAQQPAHTRTNAHKMPVAALHEGYLAYLFGRVRRYIRVRIGGRRAYTCIAEEDALFSDGTRPALPR